MDAANVDLKAFTEDFYRKVTLSHLAPVLETLAWLAHETKVWMEVTNLMIPGPQRLRAEIARARGVDRRAHGRRTCRSTSPAFHPDFKMMDRPPTPPATLPRARASRARPACATSTRATCTTAPARPRLRGVRHAAHRAGLVCDPELPPPRWRVPVVRRRGSRGVSPRTGSAHERPADAPRDRMSAQGPAPSPRPLPRRGRGRTTQAARWSAP